MNALIALVLVGSAFVIAGRVKSKPPTIVQPGVYELLGIVDIMAVNCKEPLMRDIVPMLERLEKETGSLSDRVNRARVNARRIAEENNCTIPPSKQAIARGKRVFQKWSKFLPPELK